MPVNQTRQLRMPVSESDRPLVTPSHSGNTVTLLAGRETAVAETSMTHVQPPVHHSASVLNV